ncbi:MAG: WG repeat-containing protein [Rectinemataceae bacterium]
MKITMGFLLSRKSRLVISCCLFVIAALGYPLGAQDFIPYQDQKTHLYGYMDGNGNVVIKPNFKKSGDFAENIAIVEVKENYQSYIDGTGKIIFSSPVIGDKLQPFSNGYGIAFNSAGTYFINEQGQTVSPTYDGANPFSEGIAVVWKGDKCIAVDAKFKQLFEVPIDPVNRSGSLSFHSGLMAVRNADGLWGYVDRNGQFAIRPRFNTCSDFKGSYALAGSYASDGSIGNEVSVIDRSGRQVYSCDVRRPVEDVNAGDRSGWNMPFLYYDPIIRSCVLVWNPLAPDMSFLDDLRIVDPAQKKERTVHFSKIDCTAGDRRPDLFMMESDIFFDGRILDLDGTTLYDIGSYKSVDAVYCNKFLLVTFADKAQKLITLNGEELKLPEAR